VIAKEATVPQDILAGSSAWLDTQRLAHLSRTVAYVRDDRSDDIFATVDRSVFETQTDSGVVERWESRDFIISVTQFRLDSPKRGDRVVERQGGTVMTFEVCAPPGAKLWQWADAYRTAYRVHTKLIAEG